MKKVIVLAIALASTALAGCANTSRDRNVHYSGFLGDYSMLLEGGPDQAQRRYVRPDTDWAAYRKVLLDPVTFWRGDESRKDGVSAHDAQVLMNYFYAVIHKDLESQGFQLVDSPGPGTLRVQVALTKLGESHVVMDVVSSVVPATLALSSVDKLVTGKPAFVGEAEMEYKAKDAVTGELLAAGVDHRVGGKLLTASQFSSWGDVEKIMRLWASYGSYNLCKLQERTDCVQPKTT